MDFAFVPEFLAATSPLEPAEVCRTELKPFLTIFGTNMRAGKESLKVNSCENSGCAVRLRMAGNMWKFFIRLAPVFEIMAVLMLVTVVDMLWRALSLPIVGVPPGVFVLFFSAYVLRRKYGNWRWGDFDLRRLKTFNETVLYGVTGYVIVEIIIAIPTILMAPQLFQISSSFLVGFKDIPMPDFLLYTTVYSLLLTSYSSIPEEIQYRGYMQGLTSKYMGKPWACMHGND